MIKNKRFYVYKITNKINNKFYIGVRSCVGCFFKNNYWGSGKLIKRAIKAYGKENFQREILFETTTLEEAYLKEKEIVTHDLINDPLCYNLTLGGNDSYQLTKVRPLATITNSKPIKSLDKFGNIEYFKSASHAQTLGKGNRKYIGQALRGAIIIYNNKYWSFANKEFNIKKPKNITPCISIDINGIIIHYESIAEASKVTGAHFGQISQCLMLKAKSAGKLSWYPANTAVKDICYKGYRASKKCKSIDKNGIETVFYSLVEAARSVSKTATSIRQAILLNGYCSGLKWEYIND